MRIEKLTADIVRRETPSELTDRFADEIAEAIRTFARTLPTVADHSLAMADRLLDHAMCLRDMRQRRRRFLPADLFHEHAWDMLLTMYIAQAKGEDLGVKQLIHATGTPATTAIRWIDYLEKAGLVQRIGDEQDRRRVTLHLTEGGQSGMAAFLQDDLSSRPSPPRS